MEMEPMREPLVPILDRRSATSGERPGMPRSRPGSGSRQRRAIRSRARAPIAMLLLLAGCGSPEGAAPATEGEAGVSASSIYGLDDRAGESLPASFGLGRPATDREIAAVDIDVMPDGHGLPAGSGTVADGAAIYAGQCAICHGENLEGTPLAARLVPAPGDTVFPDGEVPSSARAIGNYWPYATTLFDYIRRAMPFDRPGSLTDQEVYAVTAYLLARNGILAENATLDAATLAAVRMPARDRFVPDDRLESDRVR